MRINTRFHPMALVEVTLALCIPLLPIGLFSALQPAATPAASFQSKAAPTTAPAKIPASYLPEEARSASTMNSPAVDALVFLPNLPAPEHIAQSFYAPAPQAPPRPVVPADEEEPPLTEELFSADETEVMAETEAELVIGDEASGEEVTLQEDAGTSVAEEPQEEVEPAVAELFPPYESKLLDPLSANFEMPVPSVVDSPPPQVVIHPVSADARFAILGYVKDADECEYLLLKDNREFGPRKVRVDEARNDPQLLIEYGEDTWIFRIDTVWYSIKRRK